MPPWDRKRAEPAKFCIEGVRALRESQNDADTFPVQVGTYYVCGATGSTVCCRVNRLLIDHLKLFP